MMIDDKVSRSRDCHLFLSVIVCKHNLSDSQSAGRDNQYQHCDLTFVKNTTDRLSPPLKMFL